MRTVDGEYSNVIIIHNHPLSVIYIEDKLWIVDRVECFGRD